MAEHYIDHARVESRMGRRIQTNRAVRGVFLASTMFGLVVLAVLLYDVISDSLGWLDWNFLTSPPSFSAENAGVAGAITGTLWLMLIVGPVTMVIGVATAIYLEEYVKKGRVRTFFETNISNLAGVPSIVFGLLGLTVFVRLLGMGSVVLAGGLTMSLLVLPIVIVAAQEALRAVPGYLREASYGMGATRWQTIRNVVLPAALPSILTGMILAMSRAIGETAPLIAIGIPALLIPLPSSVFDSFTVLPVQIYYWTIDAPLTAEYAYLAAAAIIVLLVIMFTLNSAAILIRNKFQKRF
ncbi:phosphate ABC transporter permease PstA [Alkalicoccus urumqiensis]|uniref:Phosphate transport system permease protein PstA n=1 Tax=Alkalicoccus urumqiensis TaxID=1548213 RepID=A0A2P6MEZ5_ALKUR|nr:phosphate ABC transporter permease PstA [Alkalicoccus urumqiensis]PRO64879.1 phosphate ABC transporter permease PtsA [Alkalicoccus urumqiensis]